MVFGRVFGQNCLNPPEKNGNSVTLKGILHVHWRHYGPVFAASTVKEIINFSV